MGNEKKELSQNPSPPRNINLIPPLPSHSSRRTTAFTGRLLSSPDELIFALSHLRTADPILEHLIQVCNRPIFDETRTIFSRLMRSLVINESVYASFVALCGGEDKVNAATVLSLTTSKSSLQDIEILTTHAHSMNYVARKFQDGSLTMDTFDMERDPLYTELCVKCGLPENSFHLFMIFGLHRPDVLPIRDRRLMQGMKELYKVECSSIFSPKIEEITKKWQPYRSLAAAFILNLMELQNNEKIEIEKRKRKKRKI